MESYTTEEFDGFVKAMKKLSGVLRSKKPDFIFAPMLGSVPLVDVLAIIDRHFSLETVEYPPNSSRFLNREEIIDDWYFNFLDSNYTGKPMSIVCVDEVISGSSATKGYREFAKVLHKMDELRESPLERRVSYEIMGVGEKPKGNKRNHSFVRLVNQKKARVFEAGKIITADNRDLNPIRLKRGKTNEQGRQTYLPEIESINFSADYMDFLHNIAAYFGVDPEKVTPVNLLKMRDSLEKYLRH